MSISTAQVLRVESTPTHADVCGESTLARGDTTLASASARFDRAMTALGWARELASSEESAAAPPPESPGAEEWSALSVAQVRGELDALLLGRRPDLGLDALLEVGFLDAWLPEISAMVGFGDGEFRHKDVWKHTKQVVWQSVPRLDVRWGALLHDIGKLKTRSVDDKGEVHFFGHSEVGASMFKRRVARRLGFEGETYQRVHFLILHHLRASQYDGSWTDSAVRRFAREMGPGLKDLLDLSRADITTKRAEKKKRGLRQISELGKRVKALSTLDARVPPLPKGLGTAISEAFGVPPSKRLGDLRNELEQRCERGELEANQELAFYIAYLREHAAELGL
jgi:poly(A) polymerase